MANINIKIDDELHKKAKLNSLVQNISLKKYIEEAIEEGLKDG